MTWTEFVLLILGGTLIYYAYIWIKYYAKGFKINAKVKNNRPVRWVRDENILSDNDQVQDKENQVSQHQVPDLLAELKEVFSGRYESN